MSGLKAEGKDGHPSIKPDGRGVLKEGKGAKPCA